MDKKTKERIQECIREGLDFKKTKEKLAKEGITKDFHSSFFRMRNELQPEDARRNALQTMHDKKEEGKKKSLLPTPSSWNKKKQAEADNSVFVQAINEGLFYFIPCPQKSLSIEQVKEINLGGGIVGLVMYYTSINLNHPIIVFVTRVIVLVLKVRKMCYLMQEKIEELKAAAKGKLPGQGSVGSMQ